MFHFAFVLLFLFYIYYCFCFFFFFQAEDGIRDLTVTGVQTCALPISLLLHQPERRQERPLLGGIAGEDVTQLLEGLAGEHRLIFLRGGVVGRARARAHRSTSPITMSTDALIAIRSESRCPSAILGRAARLMNDGGRMRQRTGLAVPSETR